MNTSKTTPARSGRRRDASLYILLLFFVTLTGFAQMPIFKRYYISDIPGLGWLAQFYVTHFLHYLGAALLLAFFAYAATSYLLMEKKSKKLTMSGHVRTGILAGLVITGALLVPRNFAWNPYLPEWIVALDLVHLGLALVWLTTGLFWVATKQKWTAARKEKPI